MADSEHHPDVPEPTTTSTIRESLQASSVAIVGLFAIAVVAVVYVLKPVLLPLVLAMLLSAVFQPIVGALRRWGVPRSMSAAVILGTLFVVSVMAVWTFATPISNWAARIPEQLRQAEYRIQEFRRSLQQVTDVAEQVETMAEEDGPQEPTVRVEEQRLSESVVEMVTQTVAYLAMTFILLYFVIGYGYHITDRLRERLGGRDLIVEIGDSISSYLFTITVINAGLGLAVGLAMWAVGMPYPPLWGVMAFLFNFIPWLGAMVGIVLIAFVAVLTFDTTVERLIPPVIFFLLTSFEANFVTPTILGHRFPINPAVLFVWVLFWGWLWGIAGAILAVPLLMTLRLTCTYFPRLEFIGALIGDAPEHGPLKRRRRDRAHEEKPAV